MFFVNVLIGVPLAGQEWVLFTDDLAVKKGHLDKKVFKRDNHKKYHERSASALEIMAMLKF